ncbi:MAG: hypothetical protein ACQEP3_02980 [Patescibacteria group bacterium]
MKTKLESRKKEFEKTGTVAPGEYHILIKEENSFKSKKSSY